MAATLDRLEVAAEPLSVIRLPNRRAVIEKIGPRLLSLLITSVGA